MSVQHLRCTAVAVLLMLTTAACSSTSPVTTAPSAEPEPTSTAEASPAAPAENTTELEQLYWARQDSAKTLYTKADVDFMTGMIGHHAQALVMSALAPTNGASPQLQTLASRIINAQNDEIATMQQWLRDRGQTVPEVHIEGNHLMMHGVEDHNMHMGMPGMLSEAQMQELIAARGATFDRLFLKYMIQHHSGAIVMVKDLFATDGAGQDEAAFKLASDINVDQITEIARMERMLSMLPAESPDP